LTLAEAFERVVLALPFEKEFADIEIVLHRARREGRATVLTLMVDRLGGVDTALCERLARRLNAALEEIVEPYTLEVESAGLNRPLLKPADYARFAGRDVRNSPSQNASGEVARVAREQHHFANSLR